MAQYSEEWFYPNGQLATNQRAAVFGPGDNNVLASIFSDPGLTTPLPNPTVTDANGMLTFYAADGQYWIWVGPTTGGNGIEITLGASPDNPVLSVNGVSPDGGGNVELTAADVDAQPITTINAAGDLYVGTGPDATTRLPIGSNGEVLTVVAGTPSWEPGGGGAVDSVNGQTGVVVLGASDVGADPAGAAAAAQAAAIAASQSLSTIDAAGDLYVGTGPDATTRLPIGSAGEVLTVVAGVPSWEPGGGGAVDSVNGQTGVVVLTAADVDAIPDAIMDAKGDIIAASAADTPVRVAVGANGSVLRANSATTPGIEWDTLDAADVGAVATVGTVDIVYGTDDAGAQTTYNVEGLTDDTIVFTDDRNVLTAGNGDARFYNRLGRDLIIVGAWASVGIQPTGASILVDVNVNGTTIYSTQANRPSISASTNGGALSATPDTTAFAIGDYFTVDIDQIGSTIAGGRLAVGIVVRQNI